MDKWFDGIFLQVPAAAHPMKTPSIPASNNAVESASSSEEIAFEGNCFALSNAAKMPLMHKVALR